MADYPQQTGALAPLRRPPKRPSIERPMHANPDDWQAFVTEISPLPAEWTSREAHRQFALWQSERAYAERQQSYNDVRLRREAKDRAENPEPRPIEERLTALELRVDRLTAPIRLPQKSAKPRTPRGDDLPPEAA